MAQAINLDNSRRPRHGKHSRPNVPPPPPKYSKRTGMRSFVRTMKILLPLLALILIGAAVIWPQLNPVDEWDFSIPILSQQQDGVDNTTMLRVSFEGRDSKDRPYVITADNAEERDGNDDIIDLLALDADITLKDGTWVALSAAEGTFDRKARLLDLSGGVNLFQDQGYELVTEHAEVLLNSNEVHSDTPVQGQGPFGLITSEGLAILEEGQVIIFSGKTELLLEPDGLSSLE